MICDCGFWRSTLNVRHTRTLFFAGGGSGSGAGGGSADDGSAPLGAPWLLLLLFLGAAAAYPTIRYVRQKGDISAEAAIKGDTSSQNAWEAFKGFVLGGLTAGSAAIGSAGSLAEDGFKGMQQSFGDFINGLGIGADAKKYDSTTTGTAAAAGAAATNAANQQACPAAEEDSAPGIVGGVTQFLQQATGTAAEGASASSTAGKGPKENSRVWALLYRYFLKPLEAKLIDQTSLCLCAIACGSSYRYHLSTETCESAVALYCNFRLDLLRFLRLRASCSRMNFMLVQPCFWSRIQRYSGNQRHVCRVKGGGCTHC